MTVDLVRDPPAMKLIVYGSLAPGQSNHAMLASLRGEWHRCTIEGVVTMHAGYKMFRPQRGTIIAALLFISPDLPDRWNALDQFEGDDYRRVLITAETAVGPVVANIYADKNFATGAEIKS
jgi:gamma-glutamylcyclotransferase (GGCT)/AIG2-like uncharacterized protein YtfP